MDKDPGPWLLGEMSRFTNSAGDLELPARYFLLLERGGLVTDARATAPHQTAEDKDLMPPPVVKKLYVYPVVKTTRNRDTDILVGRDEACDIVVDDESVSRTHASLRISGGVSVLDLGSRNGTKIGLAPAPREGQKPGPVPVGAGVSFGDISATLLDAEGLQALIGAMKP